MCRVVFRFLNFMTNRPQRKYCRIFGSNRMIELQRKVDFWSKLVERLKEKDLVLTGLNKINLISFYRD